MVRAIWQVAPHVRCLMWLTSVSVKKADINRLHAQIKDALEELDRLIADDLPPGAGWEAHELAPARSSLAHVEWVLCGNSLS